MRAIPLAALFVLSLVSLLVPAANVTLRADEASRRREREIVDLKMELLLKVEFPVRMRRLESEIKIADEERRQAERRFKDVSAIQSRHSVVTKAAYERAKLSKLKAEYRLQDLRRERSLLIRYSSLEKRLRRLMTERAAAFGSQF